MPSSYTANYQLNQWKKTDRVLMEDFNTDNARIDAAIQAMSARADALSAQIEALRTQVQAKADLSALNSLRTTVNQVDSRAGAKRLGSGKVSTTAENYKISTAGIDWGQWMAVHLNIFVNGGSMVGLSATTEYNYVYLNGGGNHLIFFPMYNADQGAVAFHFRDLDGRDFYQYLGVSYNALNGLYLVPYQSGGMVAAGSTYEFWGEK